MKITKKGSFIPKVITKKIKANLNTRSAGSEKVRDQEVSKSTGRFFGQKWYPTRDK